MYLLMASFDVRRRQAFPPGCSNDDEGRGEHHESRPWQGARPWACENDSAQDATAGEVNDPAGNKYGLFGVNS